MLLWFQVVFVLFLQLLLMLLLLWLLLKLVVLKLMYRLPLLDELSLTTTIRPSLGCDYDDCYTGQVGLTNV